MIFVKSYFNLIKNMLKMRFILDYCVMSHLIYIFAKVLFQNMI